MLKTIHPVLDFVFIRVHKIFISFKLEGTVL